MGRQGPTVCDHGRVVDWGDFGPDPDDGRAGAELCAGCVRAVDEMAAGLARVRAAVGLHRPAGFGSGRVCVECRKRWPCLTAHIAGVNNDDGAEKTDG